MATVTKPIALDESFNTTEVTPRNIADVLAEGLSHITGRTASEVEYDNTDSGLTADNVQDAIDEVNGKIPTVPSVDIQTAVDEFSTYNGGLLSSLKVSLSPNQDLHGYENPWVGGASKNKCEMTLAKIKALNTSGTWSGNVYTNLGVTYTILTDDADNVIGFDTNGTATARGWMFISDADYGETTVYFNGITVSGYTFTSGNPSAVDNIRCIAYNYFTKMSYILIDNGATTNHEKWYPMVRLSSESDPTFEPYSNICPISGHTQVEVDVSNPNLIEEMQAGVWLATNGTYSVIAGYCCSKKFRIAPNKTYNVFATADATIGTDNAVLFYDENDNYLGQNTGGIIRSTTVPFTFTAPSNAYYCALDLKVSLSDLLTAEIVVDKEQITVNLGGTYYSGTLDVVTGVFTPDTADVDLGDLNWEYQSNVTRFLTSDLSNSIKKVYDPSIIKCEGLNPNTSPITSRDIDATICPYSNGNIYVCLFQYTDATTFKTAMSGIKLVYELATPTPIQLSPTMVKALVGENHLSAPLEGQEITESKYKQTFTFDDVIAYIQSLS